MGLLGTVVDVLKDPLTAIIGSLFPDPADKQKREEAQAAAALELAKLADGAQARELEANLKIALAQTDILKIDAASGKWWQAGWRPFIGWVCGAALAYSFLVQPLLLGVGVQAGTIDASKLMDLVVVMLGVGGYRTYEKVRGVA